MKIGTILNSGRALTPHVWEVVKNTGKTIQICELIWSPDVINEEGCMYRTENMVRLKMNPAKMLRHKIYGCFSIREKPVKVINPTTQP